MLEIGRLVADLERFYGALPAPPHDPFILFVWEVLSAQTVPAKRDAALNALKRIPALTPDAIWRAPKAKLEAAVALAGPYQEQRLRALRTGMALFRRSPRLPAIVRGPLPAARRALRQFPQFGDPGAARRMLLFAADRPVFPVDSRVNRVAVRLGLVPAVGRDAKASMRAVQHAIAAALPCNDVDAVCRTFLYLSHHGAATCTETDPHCGVCPLLPVCPEGKRVRFHFGVA